MLSPDIRPNHQSSSEENWLLVDRPRRRNERHLGGWVKVWIDTVDTEWGRLSRKAYESLSRREGAVLKPDLLTHDNQDDKFTFRRIHISNQIVTIGISADIESAINQFQLAKEVEPTFQDLQSGQKVYEITRGELFQLFIVVLAKIEVKPGFQRRKNKRKNERRIKKGLITSEDTLRLKPEEEALVPRIEVAEAGKKPRTDTTTAFEAPIEFRERPPITDLETEEEIERLMKKRPERGGPMMNVR